MFFTSRLSPIMSIYRKGFTTTAISSDNDYGMSVAVQADGKIVVAGYAKTGANNDFAVVRYKADGTLDTTFGGGDGIVTTAIGTTHDQAYSVVIQPDGKILVGGYGNNDAALVRYNSDGSLDTTFSGDGKLNTPFGTGADYGRAIVLQSDNKIVLAGYGNNGTESDDFIVARYLSDGTLDSSFGTGGKVITSIVTATADRAYSVALQSDGKICVAGTSKISNYYDFALTRYNTDGTLDTSFGGDGIVTTQISSGNVYDYAYGIAIQSDGKIVAIGTTRVGSTYDLGMARYNIDGSLDTTFGGGDGIVTTALGSGHDECTGLVLQPDGKILAVGYSYGTAYYKIAVARYNIDGTLDTAFGTNGKLITAIGSYDDYGQSIALQSDGKIIVAGSSNNGTLDKIAIARYNSNGTLDNTFGDIL